MNNVDTGDKTDVLNNEKHNEKHNENQSLWDELKETYNELKYLIYSDFYKSYLFIIENKQYFIYAVTLSIIMQFTNISYVSSSYTKYCKTQRGGGSDVSVTNSTKPIVPETPKINNGSKEKPIIPPETPKINNGSKEKPIVPEAPKKNNGSKEKPIVPETPKINNSPETPKTNNGSEAPKTNNGSEAPKMNNGPEAPKIPKQQMSIIDKLKDKFGKGSKLGGKYGFAGPVFSNMGKIFDSVKYIFSILAIILTIVGILSIPVLIFLVITYSVLKKMINRFVVL